MNQRRMMVFREAITGIIPRTVSDAGGEGAGAPPHQIVIVI